MLFADAIKLLQQGCLMRRECWRENIGIHLDEDGFLYLGRIGMKRVRQYTLNIEDIEAGDWETLE